MSTSSNATSWSDKWKSITAKPGAQKVGQVYKKAETGVWKVLDPVGRGANRLASRAGAENFWPTEIAEGELEKAARILRTFTLEGASTETGATAAIPVPGAGMGSSDTSKTDKYADRKTQKVIKKIPPKVLENASGIAIMTCFR